MNPMLTAKLKELAGECNAGHRLHPTSTHQAPMGGDDIAGTQCGK